MKTPSLRLLISFWVISSILVTIWLRGEISLTHLPGHMKILGYAILVIVAFFPFAVLACFRSRFLNLTMLGLLVCCGLAISAASHEANLLREAMQHSLDHERAGLHADMVENVIRPLISIIVDTYVTILGDSNTPGSLYFTHGGSTNVTHIAINYMFDSASFMAAFALGTVILSPVATWLCLLTVAFIAQIAPMEGRMGNVFLAGGFFWQLFLLTSGRYVVAIVSGFVISFMRTDVVFATAFAILGIAWIEQRWPSRMEWSAFAALIVISIAVPQALILLHPGANFSSFLITHGDYFTKMLGNISNIKMAVGLACPLLAVILVTNNAMSRTTAVVIPPALIYLGIVFLIADFSETRLLGPTLGALAFVCSERLGRLLQQPLQELSPQPSKA